MPRVCIVIKQKKKTLIEASEFLGRHTRLVLFQVFVLQIKH